jgi:organic hydroperoxide reductase OsmC/OhrA
MSDRIHVYVARISWTGNSGGGTSNYSDYDRCFDVEIEGKPVLQGSADPIFRGDPARYNPEDLMLAAASSCHMLTYLALCASRGLVVVAYEDEAKGELHIEAAGGGRFEHLRLHPVVTLAAGQDAGLARNLHEEAQRLCFIANSCSTPIAHEIRIRMAGADCQESDHEE